MNELTCELHVYDIKHCGLYQGKEADARHLNVKDFFKELKGWAIDSGKPLIETSTFSENKRHLESFCLGVSEHKGQYLLALWNKVPHSKSGVGTVNGTATPNVAKVSHTKVGKDDIPGYPTFFWILPSAKKLVAIRLESPSFGVGQLREYLTGYLTGFCSYRISLIEHGKTISGYADFTAPTTGQDNRTINNRLRPVFSIAVNKIPGKQEEILRRYDEVTKLVKDVFVYNNLSDDNASNIEKLRGWFNNLPPAEKKKVRIEMPVKLAKTDVSELIKLYNQNDNSEVHDVDFVFKGQSGHIEWLSGAFKKEEADVGIEWLSPDHPNIDKLLKSLQEHEHLVFSDPPNEEGNEKAI